MVILDNGSSDGTAQIILSLIEEGLPVRYVFDPNPCYEQDMMTTALLYATLDIFGPDYICPLDADEFIISTNRSPPLDTFVNAVSRDSVGLVPWITYLPPTDPTIDSVAALTLTGARRACEPIPVYKCVIPAGIAMGCELLLKQGNHDVLTPSECVVERRVLQNVALAHYPIRSVGQLRTKTTIGWLANLARGQCTVFDWFSSYCMFAAGSPPDQQQLLELARRKDLLDSIPSPPTELVPPFRSPELLYRAQPAETRDLLLSYCEDLARFFNFSTESGAVREVRSVVDRRSSYGLQLTDDSLQLLVRRSGLSTLETQALVGIATELPASGQIAIIGEGERNLRAFIDALIERRFLSAIARVEVLRPSSSRLIDLEPTIDWLIGNVETSGFASFDGPRLLHTVRLGGWVSFLYTDNRRATRELVEKWLSPNSDWTDKSLLRGTFSGRRAR